MMDGTEQRDERSNPWESIGRAAEDFARRVARDAGKFAERMEEHAGEFARDVSRDWRRARHHYRRHCARAERYRSEPDVRKIFDDIRTVLADVLDGVDELIERVFSGPRDTAADNWLRVVSNRAGTCIGCGRAIAAGADAYIRRSTSGVELRCVDCGEPAADQPPAG